MSKNKIKNKAMELKPIKTPTANVKPPPMKPVKPPAVEPPPILKP